MKAFFRKKALIFLSVCLVPITVFAATGSNPSELLAEMQKLLNQSAEKIRILEAENALLKKLMIENNIQIPLDEWNKIMEGKSTLGTVVLHNSAPTNPTVKIPQTKTDNLPILKKGFIDQIRKDWEGIRGAYSMPLDARIGGYEFVKNDAQNNVFVDIIYGNGTPEGAYNTKLLYEFDKQTFKRKLLGLFEYDTNTKVYITKLGTNPFAGTQRDIIREHSFPQPEKKDEKQEEKKEAVQTNNNTQISDVENKVLSAYQKRDLGTLLKISDEFLKSNVPTYNILLYRYRMYFLVRDFNKALAEIKKMENAKLATPLVYCDAYAVALYAKNNSLANHYKKLAGKGCTLTP